MKAKLAANRFRRKRLHFGLCVLACLGAATVAGCVSTGDKETAQKRMERLQREREEKARQAEKAYKKGKEVLNSGELADAREHFLKALNLNPHHGAAHNDLGVVYFKEGDFYDAAVQFDAACRYLAGCCEPFYNLGLVLEKAGKLEEAAESYRGALKVAPNQLEVMESLARTYVKLDTNHKETIKLLEGALLKEKRPDWQRWIRLQLLRLKGGREDS